MLKKACIVALAVQLHKKACTQVGTAARSTVLSSTGGKSLKDNIVNVFGSRLADGLVPVNAETPCGSKLEG